MKNNWKYSKEYEAYILKYCEKIPCSEEERKIYGVDFKNKETEGVAMIAKLKKQDTQDIFYQGRINCQGLVFSEIFFFKSLKKAKEFLENEIIKNKNTKNEK